MNILICGYGFVGMAHAFSLQPYYNTHIYDPMKGYETWVDCDAVIIAVSTPENEDGSCNMSNVYQVIERIKDNIANPGPTTNSYVWLWLWIPAVCLVSAWAVKALFFAKPKADV